MTGSTGTYFFKVPFQVQKNAMFSHFPDVPLKKKHVFVSQIFPPGSRPWLGNHSRRCRTRNQEMPRSWHVERAWLVKRRGEDLFPHCFLSLRLNYQQKHLKMKSSQKRKGSSSNHPFSGVENVGFREGRWFHFKNVLFLPVLGEVIQFD